jgi:uncharacterized protein (TIGR02268 family)
MRHLSSRLALFLVLMASTAGAQERHPIERNLFLSDHPRDDAPRIYVGGRVATVLHFEQPCDATRTKMLGWEGRFEPLLVGGKWVVLFPLRDLTPDDRFLLLVTLTDGTELPFTVTAREQTHFSRPVDQQVNVYTDREGYNTVLSSLHDSLERERQLREENERLKAENSVDHALAALLAKGATAQTPFVLVKRQTLWDGESKIHIRVFAGKQKAAVLFKIENQHPNAPWKLAEVRLSNPSTGESRPFALHTAQDVIAPGESGYVVVVADKSAFLTKDGPTALALELVRRDGLLQAWVGLDYRLVRE